MANDNNLPGPTYTSEEVHGEFFPPRLLTAIRGPKPSASPPPTPSAPPESEPEK